MVSGAGWQMAVAIFLGPWPFLGGKRRLGSMLVKANPADLRFLTELTEGGKAAAVIDRTYGLAPVPEAIRCLHRNPLS